MRDDHNNLSDDQVRHVAKLARLRLSDEEIHPLAVQLSAVLHHVAKLGELDLDGVEPMAHASDITNQLRGDEPARPLDNEAVLANAPDKMPPFFKVPKVLGESPES